MFLFSFCIWHFARPTYQGFSSYKAFLSISFQFKAEKPKLQAPRLYNSGNDDSLKYLLIFQDLHVTCTPRSHSCFQVSVTVQ